MVESRFQRDLAGGGTSVRTNISLLGGRQCYVSMYGHTYSKSMDQPGKVANPALGQLNRENVFFPVRVRA